MSSPRMFTHSVASAEPPAHLLHRASRHALPEARLQALTEREVDVLRLLARGQTDQEIAATLHVAARTARFHVGSILRKLLARNRAHAAVLGALFDLLQVEFAAGAPLHGLSSGSV